MIAPQNGNGEDDEDVGAMGETLGNGLTPRRDAMIERQAMREGWPIPNMRTKLKLVAKQVRIALKGENREATTAFRAILAADALNTEIEAEDGDPIGTSEGIDKRRTSVLTAIRGELSDRRGTGEAANGSNGNGDR